MPSQIPIPALGPYRVQIRGLLKSIDDKEAICRWAKVKGKSDEVSSFLRGLLVWMSLDLNESCQIDLANLRGWVDEHYRFFEKSLLSDSETITKEDR